MSKKKNDEKFQKKIDETNEEWYEIKKMKIKSNNLGIDKKDIESIVNNLSKYRDLIGCGDDGMLVINGLSGEVYLDKIRELQKMIKKIKKGKLDDIINLERYNSLKRDGYYED